MSAPEPFSFFTVAERELSAGTAVNEGGKLTVTQLNLAVGKEFDDARDELKAFVSEQPSVIAQAALPFAVMQLKAGEITSADALTAMAAKCPGMDAADARLSVIPAAQGPVLACVGRKALAEAVANATSTGAKALKLYCRGLNVLGALVDGVQSGKLDKPVLMLDILNASTRLIVASKDSVTDLGSIDTGTDAILEQVMAALGLKFPGSAAKLFYGDLYDFDEHAAKLVSALSEKAKARLDEFTGKIPAVGYLYASGLPSSRTQLLGGKLAEALGLAKAASPLVLEGSDLPSYFGGAALGLAKLVETSGNAPWTLNLAEPEADAASLVAKLAPKPAAPAPAPAPAAPAKPAAPAQAAKPAAPAAKPAQQKPVFNKNGNGTKPFQNVKAPAPSQAAKPAASAPAAQPKPAPAQKPAASTAAKPAPAKKNNVVMYGGIAAAVVVIAILAMVLSGGKKETKAPAAAPAASAAVAKEPVKTPAPEPAQPAQAPAQQAPAQPTPAPAPVVVAEPPAPEPPPPPTTGNLSIQTRPVDAEVYVDGQPKGLTPLMVYDMPIGTYTVEIRKDSYKSLKKTVEIVGGQTETLKNLVLELDRGKLAIDSEPDEVSFVIKPLTQGAGADNPAHLKGQTPAQIDDLAPGKYLVTYSREGWKNYEQTVEVKAGDKVKTAFEYKPATVRINTTPSGATVFAGSKRLGKTPLELDDVAEGTFEATVRLDGYEPETVSANVAFGGTVSRELNLLSIDRVITNAAELEILPSREGGLVLSGPTASLSGFSGTLYVRCVIAQNGKVENAEIVNSPASLTPAAETYIRNTIRSWTFTPGSRKGIAMRSEVILPIAIRAQ